MTVSIQKTSLIVRRNKDNRGAFYGCTNYSNDTNQCLNIVPFEVEKVKEY
jgi:ssDNA-binding Zn-finger/Zn-ribbon topoisomerase 1